MLLELINSASFNLALSPDKGNQMRFIYYSFVTITTLGYGDITPATELARVFNPRGRYRPALSGRRGCLVGGNACFE